MTAKERKAWLASLKVGDEVAVYSGSDFRSIRRVACVTDRVIQWEHDRRSEQIGSVNPNGTCTNQYGSRRIEPVTDEHRAIERDRMNLRRLELARWLALTPDQRARIVAILDEAIK